MSDLLKFITCGSVDDGKSTLIGHLLYDAKLLYADQEEALLLDSKVGSRGGAIDYSLLLDGLLAEREQGITIDVAYRYFTTDRRSFICADTPGHEEYTRNMACGASFADLAIILVDASKGVLTQTRRHARICALMGIRSFVFAVNKMDLVDYDEARFREIVEQIGGLRDELGLGLCAHWHGSLRWHYPYQVCGSGRARPVSAYRLVLQAPRLCNGLKYSLNGYDWANERACG